VRLYVGITDGDWYRHLSGIKPDEVNFWQPSANTQFRALEPGEPLLFKLHSPDDYVVGGGFFSHFTILPVSFVWSAFGEKNGASSEQEMRLRVEKYRRAVQRDTSDYLLGCILLQAPFFFDRPDWIPLPSWARSIVRGKGYSTDEQEGARLWNEVQHRLTSARLESSSLELPTPEQRFGQPVMVLHRLGQGAFRVIVTDGYHRQCALTGSHVLHVLDAAHIKPYSLGGTHDPTNGILLRQDVHTLFDRGYLTVTTDYRVEISNRIKEEFDNGKEYYALHGAEIHLPAPRQLRPSREHLLWHNEQMFPTVGGMAAAQPNCCQPRKLDAQTRSPARVRR
jgi:putative restriction endonuclease